MRHKASRCPICAKPSVEAYQPFCSKRCGDIDLGRWLSEHYAIPGPPANVPANDPEDESEDESENDAGED